MEQGVCQEVDPELWFPDKGQSSSYAKKVCRSCPVIEECLDYALAGGERFGVWGGTSERERRGMKRVTTAS